ncbi:triphosphoribosyl-dephospho-CoA synthase MdcB [Bradyrhizobium cajani]|uniref:Probable 2-(5''-triphosphoribosyl)-3'-dephosphocoenzyme-A synthase n=1 Tax=Bradyrhizobium cajani TaxID=1928661 RepID=A0A844T0M7_9BRAD|nr:triphosphoribosyl-dephospho-CoA synthase MdcB [Bradyrhizobium cajani]MCP3368006.1 triphosphoribosyl-dephospho-CoA synthase MdcB [Bradyrhizobium cajani]MVT71836.1 triphosphoribosyl-dephospho-CoA synthase MdcB [Bradyrhizobium cajani]
MITSAARGIEPFVPRRAQIASDVGAIGDLAADCLVMELETWPKPGLVSHVDNGSHDDMDAGTFRRSAAAIKPYFQHLADAGALGCGLGRLRIIGLEAERAMLVATSGVNTHRGAIFGLGLLCAAAGARAGGWIDPALSLGDVVARLWGASILDGPVLLHSHGSAARRRFHAGGARLEAARGFPSVYRTGLPALRGAATAVPGDAEAARVETCFALIAAVEDTNLLHRGGLDGLCFARREARRFIEAGGVRATGWRARAQSIHESFVARRLSPGGSADLLAMTLFVAARQAPGR